VISQRLGLQGQLQVSTGEMTGRFSSELRRLSKVSLLHAGGTGYRGSGNMVP